MSVIIAVLAVLAVIALVFPLVHVIGFSMYPTLKNGQLCLGRRVFRKSKCKVGGVYVFRPPYNSDEKYVVKRLVEAKDGKYYFLGDNPEDSFDSRYYGYVDCTNVIAYLGKRRSVNDGVQTDKSIS